jgi:hypothetical protein
MRYLIVLCLLVSASFFVKTTEAQSADKDVFDLKIPVTWLGVDFSEMKFIGPASGWGSESTKSPSEMRDTYYLVWNEVIQREAKNFKIEEAVGRLEINWAIDVTRRVNEKANKKEIFSESMSDYQSLTEADVTRMVNQYEIKSMSGVGFALIAEGMNKNLTEGSYWATFIDLKTKKVLFTKRVTGTAVGFGFRNYWLGSIKNVFKKMKKEFKNWK